MLTTLWIFLLTSTFFFLCPARLAGAWFAGFTFRLGVNWMDLPLVRSPRRTFSIVGNSQAIQSKCKSRIENAILKSLQFANGDDLFALVVKVICRLMGKWFIGRNRFGFSGKDSCRVDWCHQQIGNWFWISVLFGSMQPGFGFPFVCHTIGVSFEIDWARVCGKLGRTPSPFLTNISEVISLIWDSIVLTCICIGSHSHPKFLQEVLLLLPPSPSRHFMPSTSHRQAIKKFSLKWKATSA